MKQIISESNFSKTSIKYITYLVETNDRRWSKDNNYVELIYNQHLNEFSVRSYTGKTIIEFSNLINFKLLLSVILSDNKQMLDLLPYQHEEHYRISKLIKRLSSDIISLCTQLDNVSMMMKIQSKADEDYKQEIEEVSKNYNVDG